MTETTQATCPICGAIHETKTVVINDKPKTGLICPTCFDNAAMERDEAERAEQLAGREQLYLHLCPPLFRETDPFRLDQEKLQDVLSWTYGPKGLLLVGPTDRGKTRMAFLLLKRLILAGRDVAVFDCASFAHKASELFGEGKGRGQAWVKGLSAIDVLFFDDIGKNPMTERAEAEFYTVVDRRTTHMLPIIGTTNMTGVQLKAKTSEDRGAPLVRRLREFCEIVSF